MASWVLPRGVRYSTLSGASPAGESRRPAARTALREDFYERARNKVGLLKLRAMYQAESWPDWVDQDDDDALCPIVGKPEDIHIVVTGGPGKHSASAPPFATPRSLRRKTGIGA